jgi:hypothetical protein
VTRSWAGSLTGILVSLPTVPGIASWLVDHQRSLSLHD